MNKIQCCSISELWNKWQGPLPESILFYDEDNANALTLAYWDGATLTKVPATLTGGGGGGYNYIELSTADPIPNAVKGTFIKFTDAGLINGGDGPEVDANDVGMVTSDITTSPDTWLNLQSKVVLIEGELAPATDVIFGTVRYATPVEKENLTPGLAVDSPMSHDLSKPIMTKLYVDKRNVGAIKDGTTRFPFPTIMEAINYANTLLQKSASIEISGNYNDFTLEDVIVPNDFVGLELIGKTENGRTLINNFDWTSNNEDAKILKLSGLEANDYTIRIDVNNNKAFDKGGVYIDNCISKSDFSLIGIADYKISNCFLTELWITNTGSVSSFCINTKISGNINLVSDALSFGYFSGFIANGLTTKFISSSFLGETFTIINPATPINHNLYSCRVVSGNTIVIPSGVFLTLIDTIYRYKTLDINIGQVTSENSVLPGTIIGAILNLSNLSSADKKISYTDSASLPANPLSQQMVILTDTNQLKYEQGGVWQTLNFSALTPVAGLNKQVQFNDNGSFGGDSGFIYDKLLKSFTQGTGCTASGINSHAEGNSTTASGDNSHAEGSTCQALAAGSHAEGSGTSCTITALNAHAEGVGNIAFNQGQARGEYSHVEGKNCIAIGNGSHAEGWSSVATGKGSHAEGGDEDATNIGGAAVGIASHAEGVLTQSNGIASHAEGNLCKADGDFSHAEGSTNESNGVHSHTEGNNNIATGTSAHAEGCQNRAIGDYSHVEGISYNPGVTGIASGEASHCEGKNGLASGEASHSEGLDCIASGNYSHAEGSACVASGHSAHAEGTNCIALGNQSHAEGSSCEANWANAHAEGGVTKATAENAHSEGSFTIASGISSHSEGTFTTASGDRSHCGGKGNSDLERNIASGISSFSHQQVELGTPSCGAVGDNSAILGGKNNNVTGARSAAIACNGKTVVKDDNVRVPSIDSDGDIEIVDVTKGIILTDVTLGTRHRITLDNGNLVVSASL